MKHLAAGAIFGVLGFFGLPVFFKALHVPGLDPSWGEFATVCVGLVVLLFAAVAAHEAGHAAAALLVGFRPHIFIVGPVKLERRATGWAAGFNRGGSKVGGLAGGIPTNTEHLRQRLLAMIAGGPAASLLTAAAAVAVLLAIQVDDPSQVTLTGGAAVGYILLLGFAVISLFLLLISLVPTEHRGFMSDGKRILRFLTHGDEVDGEVVVLTIASASMAGQRPRDWAPGLIERGLAIPAGSAAGTGVRYLAHLRALDGGDVDAARRYLDEVMPHLDQLPHPMRYGLLLRAAIFAAAYDNDAAAARKHLERAGQGTVFSPHARTLVDAAILIAEGRDEGWQMLDAAERQLPESADRGCAIADGDLIAWLRARGAAASPHGTEPCRS